MDHLCYLCIVFVMLSRYFFCGSFVLFMYCVCHAFASAHCCLVVTYWERADFLVLVCDLSLYFCQFPMWFPGSGVVLDCIDSRSLPPFLLLSNVNFM